MGDNWRNYFVKKLFYYHRWLSLLSEDCEEAHDEVDHNHYQPRQVRRKRRFKPTLDSLYLLYSMLNTLVATSIVVVYFFADNGQCQQHLHQHDCINHVGLLQGFTGQEICHWNSDLGYCTFEPNQSWNISIVYVMGATTLITVFLDRFIELVITPLNRLSWSKLSPPATVEKKQQQEKDETGNEKMEGNRDEVDSYDIEHTPPRELHEMAEDDNAPTTKKTKKPLPDVSGLNDLKQRRLSKMSGLKGMKIVPNVSNNATSSEDETPMNNANAVPGRKKSIKPLPIVIETIAEDGNTVEGEESSVTADMSDATKD